MTHGTSRFAEWARGGDVPVGGGTSTRLLLWSGIAASVVYTAMLVVVPMQWASYSSARGRSGCRWACGGTLTDTLHVVWTALNGVLTLLAMGFGAAAFGRRFRLYSLATMLTLLAAGALTSVSAPALEANSGARRAVSPRRDGRAQAASPAALEALPAQPGPRRPDAAWARFRRGAQKPTALSSTSTTGSVSESQLPSAGSLDARRLPSRCRSRAVISVCQRREPSFS